MKCSAIYCDMHIIHNCTCEGKSKHAMRQTTCQTRAMKSMAMVRQVFCTTQSNAQHRMAHSHSLEASACAAEPSSTQSRNVAVHTSRHASKAH